MEGDANLARTVLWIHPLAVSSRQVRHTGSLRWPEYPRLVRPAARLPLRPHPGHPRRLLPHRLDLPGRQKELRDPREVRRGRAQAQVVARRPHSPGRHQALLGLPRVHEAQVHHRDHWQVRIRQEIRSHVSADMTWLQEHSLWRVQNSAAAALAALAGFRTAGRLEDNPNEVLDDIQERANGYPHERHPEGLRRFVSNVEIERKSDDAAYHRNGDVDSEEHLDALS